MMKKNLLIVAMATVAFVACSDDIAEAPPVVTPSMPEAQEIPIVFSSSSRAMTRSEFTGAEAAEKLGYQFVVSGYKGSSTENPGTIVFDNYAVVYAENTAHTTESNIRNWEYVGVDRIQHAIDRGITRQSIKYWDYSNSQYDFMAWSTGPKTAIYSGTPGDGEVLVSAIDPVTEDGTSNIKTAVYSMRGAAKDLVDCYISDLKTVYKSEYANLTNNDNPVTLTFRSLGSKVRVGIYETIPGYSVKNVKFYSAANSNDAAATPKLFTTTAGDIYTKGTYTIYFPTVDTPSDADNNQAHISFAGEGDQTTLVEFGNLAYTIAEDGEKTEGSVFLGRSSNTASMAGEAEGNYYTQYLPNERGTNLNLRVNYTLESIDGSGETIEVKGATAQVPSIYTQWKAGYAYTYLFKISDKTNGYTGYYDPTNPDNVEINSDPAGLYPITFDAVVVNDEQDATQETITLVSTPSITTYQKGSKVVDNDEYLAATGDIFVTVSDGNAESTPDLANGKLQALDGKATLYTIPDGKTEAEVIDALQMQDDGETDGFIIGRSGLVLTDAAFTLTNTIEYGVDGNTIELEAGENENKAMRFTPSAGTYAFVYTKKQPTEGGTTVIYQPVSKNEGESVAGLYRYTFNYAPAGDVKEGVLYFLNSTSGQVSVFLGQVVSNLYLDDTGTTIASGHAKTGTTYYYTIDGGMSYKAAHPVKYAEFATTVLYTRTQIPGTQEYEYTAKGSEETPLDNTAYYFKEDDGSYTYCVVYPQRTNGTPRLMIQNTTADKKACGANDVAHSGMSYFDKYTQNDGVYYTKVIKVQ